MKKFMCTLCFSLVLVAAPAWSDTIVMDGSDGIGVSSFNTGANWVGDAAPTAGNDYVTGDYRLRTPADGGSYTFAGDSLTVNNTNGYAASLMYKGTGSTGSLTIGNLILDGGMISHANGSSDICNLYGNINVVGDSTLYPKQGPINLYSDIHGIAQLTIQASDNNSAFKIWIRSSANTYTGNIVNNGRLETAAGSNLNFVIGANGVNNGISNGSLGTQQHSIFGGDFVFDLTNAGTALGDSWQIINTVAASTYWPETFNVVGFTAAGDGIWNGSANDAMYQFDQGTGMLTVVPEPATMALLGLGGLVLVRRKR